MVDAKGLSVCCLKTGTKYSSEYVNKLSNMVSRNLTIPHNFYCITDDKTDVECETIDYEDDLPGWWGKLTFFKKRPYGLKGRILYLDLDLVIVSNIDEIASYPHEFGIINDWHVPTYNSSVFTLDIGKRRKVWDKFNERVMRRFPGDQDWITCHAKAECYPQDWCLSYKSHGAFGANGKIMVFHGDPNPHQVDDSWVKERWV